MRLNIQAHFQFASCDWKMYPFIPSQHQRGMSKINCKYQEPKALSLKVYNYLGILHTPNPETGV